MFRGFHQTPRFCIYIRPPRLAIRLTSGSVMVPFGSPCLGPLCSQKDLQRQTYSCSIVHMLYIRDVRVRANTPFQQPVGANGSLVFNLNPVESRESRVETTSVGDGAAAAVLALGCSMRATLKGACDEELVPCHLIRTLVQTLHTYDARCCCFHEARAPPFAM